MKVLTFSRHFPKGHPKKGRPTEFVEKVLWDLVVRKVYSRSKAMEMARTTGIDEHHPMYYIDTFLQYGCTMPKHHTIRVGNRWNVGDMASLRVWSGYPYRSKQVEFAQVEVKRVWPVEIRIQQTSPVVLLDGDRLTFDAVKMIAENDGLSIVDFISWFNIQTKKNDNGFVGQIICWSDKVDY